MIFDADGLLAFKNKIKNSATEPNKLWITFYSENIAIKKNSCTDLL